MNQFSMKVSTKENDKYKLLGYVTVYYPLLSELGFDVEPSKAAVEYTLDSDGKPVCKDKTDEPNQALPEYSDKRVQWAFDAVFAAVKADARNKLQTKSIELKPDATIADTVEELIATAERSGAALVLRNAMLVCFKEWLKTTDKSSAVQQGVYGLAASTTNLANQPQSKKEKFLEVYWTEFAATLDTDQLEAWERPMKAVEDAANSKSALDEM